MTQTNALSRQPTKLDLASPQQFKFSIIKLPKVEYFCTSANVPGISLGTAVQQTPLKDIPVPGDKLTYGDLEISFMVDENLDNFTMRLINWYGLKDRQQYTSLLDSNKDEFPVIGKDINLLPWKSRSGGINGPVYSDATLNILSSKNKLILS